MIEYLCDYVMEYWIIICITEIQRKWRFNQWAQKQFDDLRKINTVINKQ